MRHRLHASSLIVVLCLRTGVLAQMPARTPAAVAPPSHAAPTTPDARTPVRVTGAIAKYDASTRTLTLSCTNGPVRFVLAAATRLRLEDKIVGVSDLAKLIGHRAAVRYSETGGNKTADSVHVFGTIHPPRSGAPWVPPTARPPQ